VGGISVEVTLERVPLEELRLDPSNPRVRLQTTAGGVKKPSDAADLLALMKAEPGYAKLHKQIREQGGISDPLIIRHEGTIVEGNTRFAVASSLAEMKDGRKKWGTVPVLRLPPDVPEKDVQLQMATYHVSGKTTWRAAVKADQVFQLIHVYKATEKEVMDATRFSEKKVKQYMEAHKYLVNEVMPQLPAATPAKKQALLGSKYSHALQLMTVKDLDGARKDKVQRQWLAKQIALGKLTGAQVRKIAPVIRNAQARAALDKGDLKSAKEVLRVVDPAHESTVVVAVAKLAEDLRNLDRKDLELFGEHAQSRRTLEQLGAAVAEVLGLSKGGVKRRA
jgi:hypothetical protein